MRLVPAADELEFGRPAGGAAAQQRERLDESRPVARRGGGGVNASSAATGSALSAMRVERACRGRRADARQQLQHAKAGDAVARVLGEAQERQHVLDMRGFEELRPPNLTNGMLRRVSSTSSGAAVMRGAEQHGLRLQRHARLSRFSRISLDDEARLRRLRRAR